jgi:hypothetical protein
MATNAEGAQVRRLIHDGKEVVGLATFDADPGKCDVCLHTRHLPESVAPTAVVDGKTTFGVWARMCPMCFQAVGVGLGVGRGQALLPVPS